MWKGPSWFSAVTIENTYWYIILYYCQKQQETRRPAKQSLINMVCFIYNYSSSYFRMWKNIGWEIWRVKSETKGSQNLQLTLILSIRQNYNFNMLAAIWHDIVSWFLTTSQDLCNMISKLFLFWFSYQCRTILWDMLATNKKGEETRNPQTIPCQMMAQVSK